MRISPTSETIFDTQVDTKKIFVPMHSKFVLRNHVDKKGKSPIYLHLTQEGKRERINLNIGVEKKYWNSSKERVSTSHPDANDLNLILDNYFKRITTIKTTYWLNQTPLTMTNFLLEFRAGFSRTEFNAFMLLTLEEAKPSMNPNTWKAQNSVRKKIKAFSSEILFSDINFSLIQRFKNYIIFDKGHAETTMNNNLKVFKKFINLAKKRGIAVGIDTRDIICGPTSGNKVNLDGKEVNRLVDYFISPFIRDNHKIILGLFLLSCFTGVRISDAQQLTFNNIENEKFRFISIKSNKRQLIKINLTVAEILKYCPEVLTKKYADQTVNSVLKDISKIVGITKVLTFHVGRHTFATNYLRLGGRVEILQQILGHSEIKETMVYVHIVQEELDREMSIMDRLIEIPTLQSHANKAG